MISAMLFAARRRKWLGSANWWSMVRVLVGCCCPDRSIFPFLEPCKTTSDTFVLSHAWCFQLRTHAGVMATDIMDKDLKQLRNQRWDKAFSQDNNHTTIRNMDATTQVHNTNRKATIVIEHLIQASDVAHTMQHWHIFRKWNERLFLELYTAYQHGRAEKDPTEFWYQGELGFFDFYIIPLAKKLSDCGVFGVSSDENLGLGLCPKESGGMGKSWPRSSGSHDGQIHHNSIRQRG